MLAFLLVFGAERLARAEDCPVFPWQHFGDTASEFARPVPLLFTAGAALAPIVMAPTGLDHELRLVAQDDLGGRHDMEPYSVIGPYVLGGGVLVGYLVSLGVSACDVQRPQAAMLQAMTLSFGTTVFLKWAVGREWPNAGQDPAEPNRLDHPEHATTFTPFQSFGSWPSGHTSFMFAAASSFRASTPGLGVVSWLGYPLALGVAFGMWMGDHHWMSDIVSGGLLGEAIGSSVGRAFAPADRRPTVTFGFAPVPSLPGYGIRPNGLLVHAYGTW